MFGNNRGEQGPAIGRVLEEKYPEEREIELNAERSARGYPRGGADPAISHSLGLASVSSAVSRRSGANDDKSSDHMNWIRDDDGNWVEVVWEQDSDGEWVWEPKEEAERKKSAKQSEGDQLEKQKLQKAGSVSSSKSVSDSRKKSKSGSEKSSKSSSGSDSSKSGNSGGNSSDNSGAPSSGKSNRSNKSDLKFDKRTGQYGKGKNGRAIAYLVGDKSGNKSGTSRVKGGGQKSGMGKKGCKNNKNKGGATTSSSDSSSSDSSSDDKDRDIDFSNSEDEETMKKEIETRDKKLRNTFVIVGLSAVIVCVIMALILHFCLFQPMIDAETKKYNDQQEAYRKAQALKAAASAHHAATEATNANGSSDVLGASASNLNEPTASEIIGVVDPATGSPDAAIPGSTTLPEAPSVDDGWSDGWVDDGAWDDPTVNGKARYDASGQITGCYMWKFYHQAGEFQDWRFYFGWGSILLVAISWPFLFPIFFPSFLGPPAAAPVSQRSDGKNIEGSSLMQTGISVVEVGMSVLQVASSIPILHTGFSMIESSPISNSAFGHNPIVSRIVDNPIVRSIFPSSPTPIIVKSPISFLQQSSSLLASLFGGGGGATPSLTPDPKKATESASAATASGPASWCPSICGSKLQTPKGLGARDSGNPTTTSNSNNVYQHFNISGLGGEGQNKQPGTHGCLCYLGAGISTVFLTIGTMFLIQKYAGDDVLWKGIGARSNPLRRMPFRKILNLQPYCVEPIEYPQGIPPNLPVVGVGEPVKVAELNAASAAKADVKPLPKTDSVVGKTPAQPARKQQQQLPAGNQQPPTGDQQPPVKAKGEGEQKKGAHKAHKKKAAQTAHEQSFAQREHTRSIGSVNAKSTASVKTKLTGNGRKFNSKYVLPEFKRKESILQSLVTALLRKFGLPTLLGGLSPFSSVISSLSSNQRTPSRRNVASTTIPEDIGRTVAETIGRFRTSMDTNEQAYPAAVDDTSPEGDIAFEGDKASTASESNDMSSTAPKSDRVINLSDGINDLPTAPTPYEPGPLRATPIRHEASNLRTAPIPCGAPGVDDPSGAPAAIEHTGKVSMTPETKRSKRRLRGRARVELPDKQDKQDIDSKV